MLDPIFMITPLDEESLIKAARLGGLTIHLNTDLTHADQQTLNLVCHHARHGVLRAIEDCFDRTYPAHYPDDVSAEQDHGG